MKDFFNKLNVWFKNLMLDDVDKEPDGYRTNRSTFRAKKAPVQRINNRFKEQKKHNRAR